MTGLDGRVGEARTLLIACGALAKEVMELIRLNGWSHLTVTCLPAIWHNTPEKIPEGVRRKIREVVEGDPMRFTTQLLEFDEKKFRYFHSMYHAEEGYLAATNELISLNIDLTSRRVGPMADVILQRLQAILDAHNRLPMPDGAGRVLGMRRG